MLWTYAVLYALTYVLIAGWHVIPGEGPALTGLNDGFNGLIAHPFQPEYLALLGFPLSAALAAKALITGKIVNGDMTKPLSATEGRRRWRRASDRRSPTSCHK